MFAGHRVVCHESATKQQVQQAQVIVAAFSNPKRAGDGWEFQRSILERLQIDATELVGKVLVHLDDEYGARTPRKPAEWRTYCALYTGWRHVFRNYWSEGWSAMVGRNHLMNCTALLPQCTIQIGQSSGDGALRASRVARLSNPRVEWTPLGWSANWQPGIPWKPSSARRSASIGFYGNEKYQLRPNRASLMSRFEREAGAAVDGRMLGRVGFGRGNASEYVRLMHDTSMCLQISGLSAECYRMYEALDSGCIPLLINQFGNPSSPSAAVQYQFLLGRRGGLPPFPWADSPADMRAQVAALRSDERALDGLQLETMQWWNHTLDHLRGRLLTSADAVAVCA